MERVEANRARVVTAVDVGIQVALDPPIHQGNTRYNFLVFRFPIDEEVDSLTVNLTEYGRAQSKAGGAHHALRPIDLCRGVPVLAMSRGREEIATKYKGAFKRVYTDAPTYTVVSDLFKGFTECKLVEAAQGFSRWAAMACGLPPAVPRLAHGIAPISFCFFAVTVPARARRSSARTVRARARCTRWTRSSCSCPSPSCSRGSRTSAT